MVYVQYVCEYVCELSVRCTFADPCSLLRENGQRGLMLYCITTSADIAISKEEVYMMGERFYGTGGVVLRRFSTARPTGQVVSF